MKNYGIFIEYNSWFAKLGIILIFWVSCENIFMFVVEWTPGKTPFEKNGNKKEFRVETDRVNKEIYNLTVEWD